MVAAEETPLRTYRGNCHCGAFVYEADLPEIVSAEECNCSLCIKKGYLFAVAGGPDKFRIVKGDEDKDLTTYRFADGAAGHKFCPRCATPVLVRVRESMLLLNVHAIQGVNTWTLERKPYDGKSRGSPYEVPPHKGPLPTAQVENGRLYTGGCHCGAVTVALNSKPLDDKYDERLIECNCSICERNGYLWVYPRPDQLVLSGDEANIGRYSFSREVLDKTFCKVCGVNITNSAAAVSAEKLAAMGDDGVKIHAFISTCHPVNIRTLPEVDIGQMKPERDDGYNKFKPLYVNP